MNKVSKWIAFGLLLVGLVLITVISSFIPGQVDMTSDDLYTLSPGSKALLDKLEEPVTLNFYFSRSAEDLPISMKNYAARVEALLRQYARAAGDHIKLNVVDPKPDTEEEEAAIRAGVSSQALPRGDSLFFGLVVIQADQEQTIPFFNNQREPYLEYDISRAIHQVQQLVLPRLGIISSLPVVAGVPQGFMPGQQLPQDWVFVQELRKTFDVVSIAPEDEELPENLDVLAIIHPKNLGDRLLYDIDQYVLSGKPVFIAVDPSSYVERSQTNQQQMMMGQMPSTSSSLPRLFDKWGIEYDAFTVVGDLEYAALVSTRSGGPGTRYPAWLMVDSLEQDSLVTSQLESLHLVEAGSFKLKEDSGLELTPFVKTTPNSDTIAAGLLAYTPPEEIARQVKPTGERYTIAGMLRGKIPTAFPEGKPAKATSDDDEAEPAEENEPDQPQLKESSGTSTIILIADTDFLSDDISVRRLNFFGTVALQPLNDNLALVDNSLEFLSGSEDLISLRGKGTTSRPFKVVRKLETEAQKNYQDQYQALQDELTDVQEKLRDLQSKQRETGLLVADSQARDLIEQYRTQEADKRGALREIRKKLREDIEKLDLRLALINLLVVPIMVGAFGISFFLQRNKRQRNK